MSELHLNDLSKIYLEQIAEKKDDSYLETDMKKRQANNEKARKELAKGPQMKNPHFEEVEVTEADSLAAMQARREKRLAAQRKKMGTSSTGQDFGHDYGISSAERKKRQQAEFDKFVGRGKKTKKEDYDPMDDPSFDHDEAEKNRGVSGKNNPKGGKALSKKKKVKEALDPVGKEDGDVNNDGKKDSSDSYLLKRRKAIAKALGKKKQNEEVEQIGEDITSEKGKAKMKAMIAARTTDSGRAKKGQGQNVKDIKRIGRAKVYGYGGVPRTEKVGKNPIKSNFTGLSNAGDGGNKAKRRAGQPVKDTRREEVEQIGEDIRSEKGKAKMKAMIAARTTDSGRAKPGKGQNVKDIKHIGRANVDGYGGTPSNQKMAKNPLKRNFTGLRSYTGKGGNKAARRAGQPVKDTRREEVENPSKDLKSAVKKAVKRIDHNVSGDVDKNDKSMGNYGEFVPSVDGKKKLTTKIGESYSNWRTDLAEVMDDIESKPIKEKAVKNKVTINPKLSEAVEEIGGQVLEVTEIQEDASMSPQEIQLQKKKAMIDKMIATKRQQGLSKAKKSEEPAKAVGEEMSIKDQMRISQEYNRKSPEEKKAIHKKAVAGIPKGKPKKDTRTDAQKMTDATGPRPGSRYRGD